MLDLHELSMDGLHEVCAQTRNYGSLTGTYNEILYDRWKDEVWTICQAVGHLTSLDGEDAIRVYACRSRLSAQQFADLIAECVHEYDPWVTGEANGDGRDSSAAYFHEWLGRPFFRVEEGFDPECKEEDGNERWPFWDEDEERIRVGVPRTVDQMLDLHGLKMSGLESASRQTRNYSPHVDLFNEIVYDIAAGEARTVCQKIGHHTELREKDMISIHAGQIHLSMQQLADIIREDVDKIQYLNSPDFLDQDDSDDEEEWNILAFS